MRKALQAVEAFAFGMLIGFFGRRVMSEWQTMEQELTATCDYQWPHSGRCGLPRGHGGGHGNGH